MAVTPDFNLPYPDPAATANVPRDFKALAEAIEAALKDLGVDVLDVFDSTDKTLPPSADALRRGLETKQNVLRLADNYLAASVLVNAAPDGSGRSYPDGVSMFKVSSSTGGWPAANGYVLTFRAGSGGYQIFYEMYTGAVQTDKTSRQWTRSKRDSNAFWQDWSRGLTEVDLKLADNYKAPTAAITEYPEGRSVFYVGGGTGGQGSAWATAAGATETFGFVETVRAGNAGYQTFTEMYSGTDTTATSGNRQFKRNKRDSNSFWQPFERVLDQDDLNTHNADYVRQPGYAATAGTGAAYTVTLSPAPAALVDGLAITIVPHVDSTAADPTLKIGSLAALPIRRQSGAQFAAGSIKAGQPLSLVKVGSYFLARSAAPIGTATAAQVLAGYTFQSDAVPDGGTGTLLTPSMINTYFYWNTTVTNGQELSIATFPGLQKGFSAIPTPGGLGVSGNYYAQLGLKQGSTFYPLVNDSGQLYVFVDAVQKRAIIGTSSGSSANTTVVSLSSFDFSKPFTLIYKTTINTALNFAFDSTILYQ